ncbi:MAG: hypothetical protein ACOX5R_08580 [bacterium]
MILLGFLLGFIIFVPGYPFGILGLYLLATEIPWVKRHYENFKAKVKEKVGHDPEDYVFDRLHGVKAYFRKHWRWF